MLLNALLQVALCQLAPAEAAPDPRDPEGPALAPRPAPARPPPARPPLFTGAFRAAEISTGPVWGDGDGWAVGLSARASSVLHLADLTVDWRVAFADETSHFASVGARIHPLFLFLLANNRFGAALGSLYGELGLGARARDGFDATWQWGVGADVPLSPLDAGGWWLGGGLLQIRTVGSETGGIGNSTDATNEHRAMTFVSLRLGYRLNGL